MTVNQTNILKEAISILNDQGLDQSIAYLKTKHGKTKKASAKVADSLVEIASSILQRDPPKAIGLLEEATKINATVMQAWTILGLLYDQIGDREKSKAAVMQVIEAKNSLPKQVLIAANMLVRIGDHELAIKSAKSAYIGLNRPITSASLLMYIALKVADWDTVDELIQQLNEFYGTEKFNDASEIPTTHLNWCDNELINLKVLSLWSRRNIKVPPNFVPPEPKALDGRRLRVGYLSSDFRDHPTSRLANGLFRNHDHNKVELFLYCSGWDDKSEIRKEVISHFEHVHQVTNLSDQAAADLIRSHQIDVLVELNGPTRANRMDILAYRPAPVQIDYLGWPGSVGGRVVDYIVGDYYVTPPGIEKYYPEKIIRIKETYQVNDYAAQKLLKPPTRAQMGLPEGKIILGMFNAIHKVRNEVWDVWIEILKAAPDTVMWVLDPGPVAKANILKKTIALGVAAERIIFGPRVKQNLHLGRMQCCDLMLDPWPYGGHTSTSDALFSGIPVIALEGKNFAGRVSGGLLKAAGLDMLVQASTAQYIATALDLINDPNKLQSLKDEIRAKVRTQDIFNAASKARQFEAAYFAAFERKIKGLPSVHLNLNITPPSNENQDLVQGGKDIGSLIRKPKVTLICGPWSSGTSAVAGIIAKAGGIVPGPYVQVNDPRTPETFEMKIFQTVLRKLANEKTLEITATPEKVMEELTLFRDKVIVPFIKKNQLENSPIFIKHGLSCLFLDQLSMLFDLRIIGVLRPLKEIELTRARRSWFSSMGKAGAKILYGRMMDHIINQPTPFYFVRYNELLSLDKSRFKELLAFGGIQGTAELVNRAIGHVNRTDN